MTKKFFSFAALFAATAAFGFETWYGSNGEENVNTGFGEELNFPGTWYMESDNSEGGASTIYFPKGNGAFESDIRYYVEDNCYYGELCMQDMLEKCGGYCGLFSLKKDSLTSDAHVGFGFRIAGIPFDEKADDYVSDRLLTADASSWGGVCIGYAADMDATFEMLDSTVAFDSKKENPKVKLPKSSAGVVKEFAWSEFTGGSVSGEEAAKQLAALMFKVQGADGTGHFNIMSVGPLTGSSPCRAEKSADPLSVKNIAKKSAVKAQLLGRTLSFETVVAKAELLNLDGQIVVSAAGVKTLDLSKLQVGIYVVRVNHLLQRIMVK